VGLLERIAAQRSGHTEARSDHPTNSLTELLRRREPSIDAGVAVDGESAARHGAVFACRDLIGRLVSTLPVHEYDRAGGVQRELVTPTVLTKPDGELDISNWLYQALDSALMRGNAYGLIQRYDNRGWPTQIVSVHPDCVGWSRRGSYGPVDWTLEGKPIGKWPAGDLWHLPAYTLAGCPVGVSPITYAALTIGVGLAAQRFGGTWFRDGMVPAAILTNEDEVPKTVADLVKAMWRDTLTGNREPVVLGDGWKYEPISIKPEESQFLDTIQANKADVAMFFGVEPEAIGATRAGGSSIVYQNVGQSNTNLLVRTINAWIVRLERALTDIRPRPRYVKLNPNALLRVDPKTQTEISDIELKNGTRNQDEVRELHELPPIPDGKGQRHNWPPGRVQLTNAELNDGVDEGNKPVMELVTALQKAYLAVGVVITDEEAREIMNRLGAGLDPGGLPEPDPPAVPAPPVAVGTNGQTGDI
jgi:HK97 family phage portal protein